MALFIGIGCSWLLVAVMMLWAHRRAENPETGQWRSEPSNLFGGPDLAPAARDAIPGSSPV